MHLTGHHVLKLAFDAGDVGHDHHEGDVVEIDQPGGEFEVKQAEGGHYDHHVSEAAANDLVELQRAIVEDDAGGQEAKVDQVHYRKREQPRAYGVLQAFAVQAGKAKECPQKRQRRQAARVAGREFEDLRQVVYGEKAEGEDGHFEGHAQQQQFFGGGSHGGDRFAGRLRQSASRKIRNRARTRAIHTGQNAIHGVKPAIHTPEATNHKTL